MLTSPEGARFRDKYGKLLLAAFRLTSVLVNDFLPRAASKEKDVAA
jgi:hypothetical protein